MCAACVYSRRTHSTCRCCLFCLFDTVSHVASLLTRAQRKYLEASACLKQAHGKLRKEAAQITSLQDTLAGSRADQYALTEKVAALHTQLDDKAHASAQAQEEARCQLEEARHAHTAMRDLLRATKEQAVTTLTQVQGKGILGCSNTFIHILSLLQAQAIQVEAAEAHPVAQATTLFPAVQQGEVQDVD